MRRVWLFGVGVAAAWPLAAGCESVDGFAGAPAGGDAGDGAVDACGAVPDDRNHCGGCGVACRATDYCAGSTCVPGCQGRVVYVAADGSDSRDGCTPQTAKRSIGGAVGYVKGIGAQQHEIRVCRGTYEERGLTLDYPVSLRGGYDCTTWARTPKYAWPDLDGTNETVVDNGDPTAATLAITGAAVTSAVVVDGFTFRGTANVLVPVAVTVSFRDGASAVLRDSKVRGGVASTAGSAGVLVVGSSPEITGCDITGGAGQGTGKAGGSVGLSIGAKGQPAVHSNWIRGGLGRSAGEGVGSTGLLISSDADLTGTRAIALNVIEGGSGSGNEAGGGAAAAVVVQTVSALELTANTIYGGVATCTKDCVVGGVFVDGVNARLRILANRIHAGDLSGAGKGHFYGVLLNAAPGPLVFDNQIHAGSAKGVTVEDAHGVFLSAGADAAILNNTIYSPPGAVGVTLATGTTGASVDNNLFLGSGGSDHALSVATCQSARLKSAFSNGFVGLSALAVQLTGTGGCTSTSVYSTTADLELAIRAGGALSSGNVRLAASCPAAEAGCTREARCDTSARCIGAVLSAWTEATAGRTELAGAGWKLADNGWCSLLRGGADWSAVVTKDSYGAVRTMPLSIGAHENDGSCR